MKKYMKMGREGRCGAKKENIGNDGGGGRKKGEGR